MPLISKGRPFRKPNCSPLITEFKPRHIPQCNAKEWLEKATPEQKAFAIVVRRFLGVEKAVRP